MTASISLVHYRSARTALHLRRQTTRLSSSAAARSTLASGPFRRAAYGPIKVSASATEPGVEDTKVVSAPRRGTLINGKTAYAEQHWVRGYEVAPDRRATFVSLGNLMQECATNHVVALWGFNEELGFAAAPVMVEKGLILVTTRQQLQITKYPKWGEAVEVETWYQQEGRLAARRDWVMRDGVTKQVIGGGTSTWVMVNMNTRKLSRIPDEMRDEFLPFAPEPPRHSLGDMATKLKLPDLQLPAEYEGPVAVTRRSDMDMNGHVNNTTFLSLCMESVPEDIFASQQIFQIEIDFKAECQAGEYIESLCSPTNLPAEMAVPDDAIAMLHVVRKAIGGQYKELVRARTVWVPRS